MAAPSKLVGHECEFVDQPPEDYYCKQCSHVAREPAIATCCGETFCGDCINTSSQAEQPCPACQEPNINSTPQRKYKTKILALKVHCSLKDRGCEWTGQLQHLNAHLDLTTGDCVYVHVDCPSKCNQKVQKCNVDTHLANHCPNRDYTCPHCSFKATFREVSEHFEVCRYYPLVCPNRCGASFERDVLEEHMKMCGLQKVQCEFSYAGCEAEFIRDHQKEHMEQNTQKHLALVAAATLRISQEQQRAFDQKLEDKDSEIKAVVNKTSQLVNEQRQQSDAQIRGLKEKLKEQQRNFELTIQEKDKLTKKELEEQRKLFEKKLREQREEFHKQQRMLEEKLEVKDQQIATLVKYHGSKDTDNLHMEVGILPYEFTLPYKYSKSPHMYTHPGGYKFYMSLWPRDVGNDVAVTVYSAKGDHDDKLKFPAKFIITLELLNQHRDQDHHSKDIKWAVHRPSSCDHGDGSHFIPVTDLEWNADRQTQYLKENCLKFRICKIKKN